MDEDLLPEEQSGGENKQDEKSISADLIRGHINTIILRSLADGDKYGYEIIAEIERKSHEQYSLKQPSLYSALKRLESQGYVTSYWGGSVGGGRRKYFSLTDEGKAIAEQNQSEWEYSRTIIDSLISDKDFDFSNPAPSAVNMRVLKSTTSRVPVREGEYDELDYTPAEEQTERARLAEELEQKTAELEAQKAAYEADKARYEDELREIRAREEMLRAEKEEQEREFAERERIIEEEKQQIESLVREQPDEEELERNNEALKEREAQLIEERNRYEQALSAREQAIAEDRIRYEQAILQRDEALEAERKRHAQELEEQEKRILEEQEILFRQREQQLLHQNYLNLVNAPPAPVQETNEYNYYTPPVAQEVSKEEPAEEPASDGQDEREYRSVVRKLYSNSIQTESPKPLADDRARSLDGIDFNDLEKRAAQDGIRLMTAGGKAVKTDSDRSESVVHKGKALFLSALVVFCLCVIEGAIVLAVQKSLNIPTVLPYLMWAFGLALLLVTGLAYANHYGEHALRRTGPVLINVIVAYALAVIITLIVALAANIDFSDPSKIASFIVIPIIYFFGIVVFGVTYWFLVRPPKN